MQSKAKTVEAYLDSLPEARRVAIEGVINLPSVDPVSPVRMRFAELWPISPRPSRHVHPSHQPEDMGARFGEPSG